MGWQPRAHGGRLRWRAIVGHDEAAVLKLKSLRVNKYRYDLVRPGATLHFSDGVNVFLGRNGSGKTTLLNLIAMVVGANFAGLEEEAFDLEYDLTSAGSSYAIKVRNKAHGNGPSPTMRFELELSAAQEPGSLTSALVPGAEPPAPFRYTLRVSDGRAIVEAGERRFEADLGGVSPFSPGRNFILAALGRIHHSANPLDPGFDSLLELSETSLILREPSHVALETYDRFDEATSWLERVFSQAALLCQPEAPYLWMYLPFDMVAATGDLEAQIDADSPPQTLSGSSATVPLLATVNRVLGFRETTFRLDLTNVEATATPRRYLFGNLRFYFKKHDGSMIPFDRLSFGQKRLFGYFYYLGLHEWFAVADELANGMHHAMINDCLAALGDRQAFMATQNPLLLDHLSFESAEEVVATFVLCEPLLEGNREQWVWRHLTADEAGELFRDYQVGVQHTNDILRTRGLW
jgi:energy-coupling factor transporter ATP-binding protein EcfA2